MKRNLLAALVLILLIVLFPAVLFAYRAQQDNRDGVRVIEIQARVPESGGFTPDRVELVAGETVRLRLVSPDVVHGFFIPELGVDVEEVYPGKPLEVTITPEKPGRYAFACIRWCSADHWRMRGMIEVVAAGGSASAGREGTATTGSEKPLFEQLGIDLDAMRPTPGALPRQTPSASRSAALAGNAAERAADSLSDSTHAGPPGDVSRWMSPADAFGKLRANPANTGVDDDALWDQVAWIWLKDLSPEKSAQAQKLYSRDCAACHGEAGRGDGVAGKNLPGMAKMDPTMRRGPADLTDAGMMLSASDALLQGKILRGGMGTGMPEFGSLYTDQELWAMVSYLRTFLFSK